MKTVLNVKTDKHVKEEAQLLAKHIGIPLSTVVNAYLKEFITTGEVRLSREPKLRPEVAKRLSKHLAESKQGKGMSPIFNSAEDAIAYLNS
jgi:antitoxin component of RelBE/YafQ-DinJ toxin-antitoxin module